MPQKRDILLEEPSYISTERHKENDTDKRRNKQKNTKGKYKIATWNVRIMYQGKLENVNQEMKRLNIDILGVSELRWRSNGHFNSEETNIYFSGNESMKRN